MLRYLAQLYSWRRTEPKAGHYAHTSADVGVKDNSSTYKKDSQIKSSDEQQAEASNLEGQLGYYLAGLIESDGTIITPSSAKANDVLTKIKKNTPTIKIIFQIKDKTLAVLCTN